MHLRDYQIYNFIYLVMVILNFIKVRIAKLIQIGGFQDSNKQTKKFSKNQSQQFRSNLKQFMILEVLLNQSLNPNPKQILTKKGQNINKGKIDEFATDDPSRIRAQSTSPTLPIYCYVLPLFILPESFSPFFSYSKKRRRFIIFYWICDIQGVNFIKNLSGRLKLVDPYAFYTILQDPF